MKRLLVLFTIVFPSLVFACDSCNDFDYFNINNKGYIGATYRYSYYNGHNNLQGTGFKFKTTKHSIVGDENTYTPSKNDYEAFHTLDLRFNYLYKQNLNFLVVLPFRFSYDYRDIITPPIGSSYDSTIVQQGLGDIYFIISPLKKIENDLFTHIIKPGIGLSIPTGKHQVKSPQGIIQDPIHQPGKGTAELILQFNYTMKYQENFGFFSTNRYYNSLKKKDPGVINSGFIPDTYHHRFGNRFSSTNYLFYSIGYYLWKFIPKVGLHYENIKEDFLNGEKLNNLGGTSLLLTTGLDIKFKDFTLITGYSIPIYQDLNGDQLLNVGRSNLGLLYNF